MTGLKTRSLQTNKVAPGMIRHTDRYEKYVLFGLRVVIAWILLQSGIEKLLDPSWTASSYLQNAVPAGNPFVSYFTAMAGLPMVDLLVVWGLTLTGLGILCGALLRWNAFWASVMMFLFWASSLQGGPVQGFPLENGWVVDSHIVYIAVLCTLSVFGAGRIYGIDRWLEQQSLVEHHPWLRYLLG